jgi:hypothetical protein
MRSPIIVWVVLLALVLAGQCPAAFNVGMQWDVRTTGSDANGGGFDPTVVAPGTDFSQQNSAQISYTDIVVGATTTQGTSVLHPFDSTIPGNVINVTAGAGCTVQRVEVLSVSGTTATFDKSLGTAASTCTGALGGSTLTINVPAGIAALGATFPPGNTINIKAGTYTVTSSINIVNGGGFMTFSGYSATHGDLGTRPLITSATNSVNLFDIKAGASFIISNINFSHTATTRGDAFLADAGDTFVSQLYVDHAKFTGVANVFSNAGAGIFAGAVTFRNVEVASCTVSAITTGYSISIQSSWIHDCTKDGIISTASAYSLVVSNSVFSNNGEFALQNTATNVLVSLFNVALYKNGLTFTGHPFSQVSSPSGTQAVLINSIVYGGGAVAAFSAANVYGYTNGVDSQAIPASGHTYTTFSDKTLTVDPFVNAAGGNFALNTTAGGGAALAQAAFPGVSPMGTGYLDIGPIQTSGAPGTGGVSGGAFVQ